MLAGDHRGDAAAELLDATREASEANISARAQNADATARRTGPPEDLNTIRMREAVQNYAGGDVVGERADGGTEDESRGKAVDSRHNDAGGAGSADGGVESIEGNAYRYSYARVEGVSRNGKALSEAFAGWGIKAVVTDGNIDVSDSEGNTSHRYVSQAAAAGDAGVVFINNSFTEPEANTLGHEAFHIWKGTPARDTYIETLRDNIDYGSAAFKDFQSKISNEYRNGQTAIKDRGAVAALEEELFAYISGQINDSGYEYLLKPMLRDYDAVKAAWNRLVESNSSEVMPAESKASRELNTGSIDPRFAENVQVETRRDSRQKEPMRCFATPASRAPGHFHATVLWVVYPTWGRMSRSLPAGAASWRSQKYPPRLNEVGILRLFTVEMLYFSPHRCRACRSR